MIGQMGTFTAKGSVLKQNKLLFYSVADPGFVERGVVRPWDPSKGRVLDQVDVPPPAQCAEAFSNYVHT